MNKKISTYVLGFLLIIFGIIFVVSPVGAFESIVMVAGIILIFYNLVKIIASVKSDNPYASFGISGSIIGVLFGFLLIANKESAIKVIPVILGIWLLVTGITSLLFAVKTNNNRTFLIKSLLKVVLGFITLLLPVIPVVATGIVLGVVLVLAGVSTFTNAREEEVVYKVKIKK